VISVVVLAAVLAMAVSLNAQNGGIPAQFEHGM
jgi:hypothetical protein